VNLLGDTIKKNTEILIDASKEVGLEINLDKTTYMLLSRLQNVGQNQNIKITDHLKICQSSNICGRQQQTKIWFRRTLRGD
jgi:glycosylphosphatidylinositol transamidase (GPIT) subunit GPI8